jgi:uncharacterized protein YcfJ
MLRVFSCSALAIILAGCATAPVGPRVAVMPAQGKPFELFAAEEQLCRNYAEQSVGQSRDDAATKNFIGAAAVGTVIGAIAGSMSGAHNGAGGGAAAGLLVGSMAGGGKSAVASNDAQHRYDISYEQCMYAKGNQVPGFATHQQFSPAAGAPYPPPPPPR